MIYRIEHDTIFRYSRPVSVSQQLLRLRPRSVLHQALLVYKLALDQEAACQTSWTDVFGNHTDYLEIMAAHSHLVIHSEARVDVRPGRSVLPGISPAWEEVAALFQDTRNLMPEELEAARFCFRSPNIEPGPEISAYARQSFSPRRPLLEAVIHLTDRIHADCNYVSGVTDVATSVDDVLYRREGVCQDFAHLEIACLRSLGLPARYVSGYLMTYRGQDREQLIGSDASHAWISAWCPSLGWIDFDPTNNVIPESEHVTIGWGREYHDVSPVNGFIIGGGEHSVDVKVSVTPVH